MATNSNFDMKKALADIPAPLAFWMMLSLSKQAAANSMVYSGNGERTEALLGVCGTLQSIADEMKLEKAARAKAAEDRIQQTLADEAKRAAGSKK